MNKFKLTFLLFLMVNSASFASGFSCSLYHLSPSNTLGGISVFNADYIGDKHTVELAPGDEIQKENIITQFWDLDPYRDKKLFVNCIYEDDSSLIKEIPSNLNTCKVIFSENAKNRKSTVPTQFFCFKK